MRTSLQLLALALLVEACSSSSFSSGGGNGRTNGKKKDESSGMLPQKPSGDARPDTGKSDHGDGDDDDPPGSLGKNAGGSTANDSGNGGGSKKPGSKTDLVLDECLNRKADYYNILLIFDASESQLETDPGNVRQQGGLVVVDQFADYVSKNPKAKVNIATLAFNHTSIKIGPGWVRVRPDTVATIRAEVTRATSTPSGFTAYSPVLRQGIRYFETINDVTKSKRSRNFIAFITDGEPNASFLPPGDPRVVETMQDISNAVTELTSRHKVAFIAVATGADLREKGEQIVRDVLAKPDRGVVDADHFGLYRRARDGNELRAVLGALISDIGSCR